MTKHAIPVLTLIAAALSGCAASDTFTSDVSFLKKHVNVIVLQAPDTPAQIAVVPDYQGRVMTSTIDGRDSFGWLNYSAIASGIIQPHINAYGGEERFWMGPEGGQFAIFFKKGDQFTLDDWQTPPVIDTEPFSVTNQTPSSVSFQKEARLTNRSGTRFDLKINRTITLLDRAEVQALLNITLGDSVRMVAFQSDNRLTNTGSRPWTKDSGLLSIWLLNMLKPSDQTTIVIPIKPGSTADLGPKVNDAYFGKVPADRLIVKDNVLFFSGDGKYRCKIGISPRRARGILGSYDAAGKTLTLVSYSLPQGITDYVNSMWEHQSHPYSGDVANSYNDGPPAPGKKPLGPFYELETSSPALALQPGQSAAHQQRSIHLKGSYDDLDAIARKTLGVSLNQITSALPTAASTATNTKKKILIPRQNHKFTCVYQPAGDRFFGPDTPHLKQGQWYDQWVPNDHTFIKDDQGRWHIIGITHPLVKTTPLQDGIHEGEFASFHAVSTAAPFAQTLIEHHYQDLPKILPPHDRPGEPLANHAPSIVKKDGLYYMIYGHSPIRLAVSSNLTHWQPRGTIFAEEQGARDPDLFYHQNTWYLVYCTLRTVRLRHSADLIHWSEPKTIFSAETFDPESPTLITRNHTFYLFVCSWNGIWDGKDIQGAYQHTTYVYQSDSLDDFGVGSEKQITTLNAHAPQIIRDEQNHDYLSSAEWPFRGISITPLTWQTP